MPLSSHPYLLNTALIYGSIFPILTGLRLLQNPTFGFDLLGFTTPTNDPATQKLSESLFMFRGARDLALGVNAFLAWRSGNRFMLGCMLLVGGGLTVVDGLIHWRQEGSGMWKHWIFSPWGIGIGGGLLGWFD